MPVTPFLTLAVSRGDICLASLILAQDERWRRA